MQSRASHPSLRMINVCCPTLGMNERGASVRMPEEGSVSSLVAGVGYGEGRLTVSDNGRGIRASEPDRVWIETHRRVGPADRGPGGSGKFGSGYDHVAYVSGDDVTRWTALWRGDAGRLAA